MLLYPAMRVSAGLTKITGSIVIENVVSWVSSPQAEKAGNSVAHHISPAVDLVVWIFAREAFWVATRVSSKRIVFDQGLLQSSTSRLNDLDWPFLPASDPGLLLLLLHSLFQLPPGVGGTKMQDFQNFPSQLFFFLFFSNHRADFFQSLLLYIGLEPALSAATISL